ncbi:MAG: flippase-like domain-containing protein [Deltaproteobacteria bacterium]|nr:flippase-like domain-containing protein [Deltaproteobacteria bacterium]
MPRFILKLLVTTAILFLLFRRIDANELSQALSQTSYRLFTLALLFLFIILILPAISQKILFKGCRLDLKAGSIYNINLKSMFYSLVVPGDLASGLARFLKFSRAHRGARPSEGEIGQSVLVVMAVDRFLNMAAVIAPIPFLLLVSPLPDKTIWFQKASSLAAILFFLGALIGHRCPLKKIFSLINRGALKKIGKTLERMTETFQDLPTRTLSASFTICLVYQIAGIFLIDIVLAKSLGLDLPWLTFFSMAAVIRFARYIPVTLSGIGVREGLFPLFLVSYGVPFETALTLGLLGSVIVILAGLVGGLLEGYETYFSTSSSTARR